MKDMKMQTLLIARTTSILFGIVTGFCMQSSAAQEVVLYSFTGNSDGYLPNGGLVPVGDKLYGTTFGGAYQGEDCDVGSGCGTVFRVSTTGAFKTIHSFHGLGVDGGNPNGGLIYVGGTLFGTTEWGGAGNVFAITPGGTEKTIIALGSVAEAPVTGLVNDSGTFYAASLFGENNGDVGGVFSITPAGVAASVYQFGQKQGDGYDPNSLLLSRGTFYGTTLTGGNDADCVVVGDSDGCGTVFSLTTTGVEKVLYRFTGGSEGVYPNSLIKFGDAFYGTAYEGGASNFGTVFSITTRGVFTVIHTFTGGSDGAYPRGPLIALGSTLYGTTAGGGSGCSGGCGTIFRISNGQEQVVYAFAGGKDGAAPAGAMTYFRGSLYGVTQAGGKQDNGTIFKFTP